MRILYFASVRDAVGVGEEEVTSPPEVANVADLIDWLSLRSPSHAAAFEDRERLRAAVDQAFVQSDATVIGAREVALFPPVTGG